MRLLLENVPEVDHGPDDDDECDDELLRPNMEEAIRHAQQVRCTAGLRCCVASAELKHPYFCKLLCGCLTL